MVYPGLSLVWLLCHVFYVLSSSTATLPKLYFELNHLSSPTSFSRFLFLLRRYKSLLIRCRMMGLIKEEIAPQFVVMTKLVICSPTELDLKKQDNFQVLSQESGELAFSGNSNLDSATAPVFLTIVVSTESTVNHSNSAKDEFPRVDSPVKSHLSRSTSFHEECRVCQQENEEELIDLGCKCKGGLSKAHHSCINTWFRTRGSNKCEICQEVAVNVSPPESQPSQANYWVWRIDPTLRPRSRERGCFSPLWVAFSILIGGLLLDVLISITLGVSALPVNIIIGVIVVLGLGTALRLALEFCHEWSFRRVVQRADTNANLGFHPAV